MSDAVLYMDGEAMIMMSYSSVLTMDYTFIS